MDEFTMENIDRKLKKHLGKHVEKTIQNRDETLQSIPEKHEGKNTENSKTKSKADLDRTETDHLDSDSESDKSESLDDTENSYDESLFLSEEWSVLNKLLESHLLITRS